MAVQTCVLDRKASLLLACVVVGCSGTQKAGSNETDLPPAVKVDFRQALLAPTKAGGAPWDGPGTLEPETTSAVTLALSRANPQAELVALLATPVFAALDKPEPYGEARVLIAGSPLVVTKLEAAERDTLTPNWSSGTINRMPLQPNARLEVALYDRDLVNDDAMGVAVIAQDELIAALRAGNVYPVRVAEQTHQQVLFVSIAVYARH